MRRLIEPSHLDICCLLKPVIACGSERVKGSKQTRSTELSPLYKIAEKVPGVFVALNPLSTDKALDQRSL